MAAPASAIRGAFSTPGREILGWLAHGVDDEGQVANNLGPWLKATTFTINQWIATNGSESCGDFGTQ